MSVKIWMKVSNSHIHNLGKSTHACFWTQTQSWLQRDSGWPTKTGRDTPAGLQDDKTRNGDGHCISEFPMTWPGPQAGALLCRRYEQASMSSSGELCIPYPRVIRRRYVLTWYTCLCTSPADARLHGTKTQQGNKLQPPAEQPRLWHVQGIPIEPPMLLPSLRPIALNTRIQSSTSPGPELPFPAAPGPHSPRPGRASNEPGLSVNSNVILTFSPRCCYVGRSSLNGCTDSSKQRGFTNSGLPGSQHLIYLF